MGRKYLMAIGIWRGIITLIEEDGTIAFYRQRGIHKLPRYAIYKMMKEGKLDVNWRNYRELPRDYSIYFEDEEVSGRAYATFNPNREG